MILPPQPIIQKTFVFLDLTIQSTFYSHTDEEGTLIKAFDDGVFIIERINRPDVYDTDKKQAIACYPIYGWSFGVITLREVNRYKLPSKYVSHEVIDGGHRIRTLREFIKNEFPLPYWAEPVVIDGTSYEVAGEFYDDLDPIVKQKFNNYKLMFVVYDKTLNDFEAGIVFNWQNKMSDLNDIEKFNSIQTMISNYVRERSRTLTDGMQNKSGFTEKHRLFHTENVKNKNWPVGSVIKEEDSRLRFQYILSQIVFWHSSLYDKNNKPISHFDISRNSYGWDDIYLILNEEDQLWKTKQKVRVDSIENTLDQLHKVLSVFNDLSYVKTSYLTLRFVYIIIHELKCIYGVNNVKINPNKFGQFLSKVISDLKGSMLNYKDYKGSKSDDQRSDTAYKIMNAFVKTMNFLTASKVIAIARDGSETFKSAWPGADPNLEKLDEYGVSIIPKTSLNQTDKDKMYSEQGQNCAFDGHFCRLEDMDFAHDIARANGIANGAETTVDSGKLVYREYNNMMGQMSISDFLNSDTFKQSKERISEERLKYYNLI